MKKILNYLSAAAAAALTVMLMAVTVFAQDYEFDVSDAKQSNGSWGQSFVHYTALSGEEYAANFNPTWMTSDSEVIVEYTYEGNPSASPVELIWQTWADGPNGLNPDAKGTWNKIAPYEYTDNTAKFSYSDIVAAFGTDNFDTVYAIDVGDSGVKLTVTAMTITNCNIESASEETEAETEAETEEETEAETEAETEEETEAETEEETEAETEEETEAETEAETEKVTEAETEKKTEKVTEAKETTAKPSAAEIAANAPGDDSILPIILIIVAVVVVAVIAVVIIVRMIKNNKGKYY